MAMAAASDQQFCLRWNNYQTNITTQFEALRTDEDFVDVTLACEGQRLEAHKIVLSACSPYFKELFKSNPCPHPIIFMRDVELKHVKALLEFMYMGEVNVAQANLSGFLRTAESLQIRGLTESSKQKKCTVNKCNSKRQKEEQQQLLQQQYDASGMSTGLQDFDPDSGSEQEAAENIVDSSSINNNRNGKRHLRKTEPSSPPAGAVAAGGGGGAAGALGAAASLSPQPKKRAKIDNDSSDALPENNTSNNNNSSSSSCSNSSKAKSSDAGAGDPVVKVDCDLSEDLIEPKLELQSEDSDGEAGDYADMDDALFTASELVAGTSGSADYQKFSQGSGELPGTSGVTDQSKFCQGGTKRRLDQRSWRPSYDRFTRSNGVIKLGEGIEICEEQLRGVKWTDYRKLTRGLATILFSPVELATCSVTGQRWSRAGSGQRPVKPALDKARVQAIISYVATRFPAVEISRIKQVLAYKCKENSTAFKMKAIKLIGEQQWQPQDGQQD